MISIPVAFETVLKPIIFTDTKTAKDKRKSNITKNQILRDRLNILVYQNNIKFKYVVWDTWYSSSQNMDFVVKDIKRHFLSPIKKNRNIALTLKDKLAGNWIPVSSLDIKQEEVCEVWIKRVSFPVILKNILYKQRYFKGVLYLVSDDTTLDYRQIIKIYKKRWN